MKKNFWFWLCIILILQFAVKSFTMLYLGFQAWRLIPDKTITMLDYEMAFSFAWLYMRGWFLGVTLTWIYFSKVKE